MVASTDSAPRPQGSRGCVQVDCRKRSALRACRIVPEPTEHWQPPLLTARRYFTEFEALIRIASSPADFGVSFPLLHPDSGLCFKHATIVCVFLKCSNVVCRTCGSYIYKDIAGSAGDTKLCMLLLRCCHSAFGSCRYPSSPRSWLHKSCRSQEGLKPVLCKRHGWPSILSVIFFTSEQGNGYVRNDTDGIDNVSRLYFQQLYCALNLRVQRIHGAMELIGSIYYVNAFQCDPSGLSPRADLLRSMILGSCTVDHLQEKI